MLDTFDGASGTGAGAPAPPMAKAIPKPEVKEVKQEAKEEGEAPEEAPEVEKSPEPPRVMNDPTNLAAAVGAPKVSVWHWGRAVMLDCSAGTAFPHKMMVTPWLPRVRFQGCTKAALLAQKRMSRAAAKAQEAIPFRKPGRCCEAELNPEPKAEPKVEARAQAPKPKAKPKAEPRVEAEPKAEPEPRAEPRAEPSTPEPAAPVARGSGLVGSPWPRASSPQR